MQDSSFPRYDSLSTRPLTYNKFLDSTKKPIANMENSSILISTCKVSDLFSPMWDSLSTIGDGLHVLLS